MELQIGSYYMVMVGYKVFPGTVFAAPGGPVFALPVFMPIDQALHYNSS